MGNSMSQCCSRSLLVDLRLILRVILEQGAAVEQVPSNSQLDVTNRNQALSFYQLQQLLLLLLHKLAAPAHRIHGSMSATGQVTAVAGKVLSCQSYSDPALPQVATGCVLTPALLLSLGTDAVQRGLASPAVNYNHNFESGLQICFVLMAVPHGPQGKATKDRANKAHEASPLIWLMSV